MDKTSKEASSLQNEKANRKLKRKLKKAQKLIAEFEVTRSNDELNRPGQLLDAPDAKKIKVEEQPGERKRLSPEEFKELKKRLQERKRIITARPRFYLRYAGSSASLSVEQKSRVPLMVSDIQQLILYALGGPNVSHPPERWCVLEKYNNLSQIVVLIVEGLTCQHFFNYEYLLPKLTAIFENRVEVLSPAHYGSDIVQDISTVSLSLSQKQAILEQYGTLEAALQSKEVFKVFRSLFPINFQEAEEEELEDLSILSSNSLSTSILPPEDIFPRTYLLLSLQQMILQDYPLPFDFDLTTKYSDYKMTKKKYKEVTLHSPIFAIDCEMCITAQNPSELTRIAIVDENLKVVYESLVKPFSKITNYLTEFSGITKEMLEGVETTLKDVQKAIRKILPDDAILVGHSLNSDLHAMKMIHPYVIDTSVVFNLCGIRAKKPRLAHLVETFLNEEIQQSERGHCPVEDATATMRLIRLKLSRGFRFGDALTGDLDNLGIAVPEFQLSCSIFKKTSKAEKSIAVIASEKIIQKYKKFSLENQPDSFVPFPSKKSSETIKHLQENSLNHRLSLAHLDFSKKIKDEIEDEESLSSLISKVDGHCEDVFKNLSDNSLFLFYFTGSKKLPENFGKLAQKSSDMSESIVKQINQEKYRNEDSNQKNIKKSKVKTEKNEDNTSEEENTKTNNIKNEETNEDKTVEEKNLEKIKKSDLLSEGAKLRSHHNGVCFIRVKSAKI